jgi:thioredoxin reductase (NADPH)
MKEQKELIIIGAGIAGMAAAIYAKRSGLDFFLFEDKAPGGQLLLMENIDNYIGLGLGIKGKALAGNLERTLSDLEINIQKERAVKLEIKKQGLVLTTKESSYSTKSVIIATGASFKKLGIQGEENFLGKGVSYCAVCDGFFFKGKEVAVVGGGNTAVEEALYLSEIAKKVTLIHRRDKLRALDCLQKDLFAKKNIEVRFNSRISQIKGSGLVEELVLEDTKTGKEKSLTVQGLFVAIGIKPNSGTFKDIISLDEAGFILTNDELAASVSGIWAAGDCRNRLLKQLITAASEGAIAAMSVYKYLKGHYISA